MSQRWLFKTSTQCAVRSAKVLILVAYCVLRTANCLSAAPKLAPAKLEGQALEDLAAPYNLQVVTLKKTTSLSWEWVPPDPGPAFLTFGYEITRDGKVIAIVPKTAYTDSQVPLGTHTYRVRAKGNAKDLRKKIAHYSGWSEPVESKELKKECSGPPVIRLTVEPTKKMYGSIPSLRLHFIGNVTVPEACTAEKVMFHIDSGLSTERAGPLSMDAQGHFDEFIDAVGGEEEPITGGARFAITVTAHDEVGDAVSNVYTIDLERENPFAPNHRE
jgi:hypothetical protein